MRLFLMMLWAYQALGLFTESTSDGRTWGLVMKLSKNDFCYGSSRWTDGVGYNEDRLNDGGLPAHKEYDAKAAEFHTLETTELRFVTQRGELTIPFESSGTPERLMTTNDIKFVAYPDWDTWKGVFADSVRKRAPMFVRAGEVVTDPAPICRNANFKISGCGKPCVFCMMAGDGHGCPTSGGANDVSLGVGNNAAYCGGGDAADCSASGNWAGDTRVSIWAHFVPPTMSPTKMPTTIPTTIPTTSPTMSPTMNYCTHLNNGFVSKSDCEAILGCVWDLEGQSGCALDPENRCASLEGEACGGYLVPVDGNEEAETGQWCELDQVTGYCVVVPGPAPAPDTGLTRCTALGSDLEVCHLMSGCDVDWGTLACAAAEGNACDELDPSACLDDPDCVFDWEDFYCEVPAAIDAGTFSGRCDGLERAECRGRDVACTWSKNERACLDSLSEEELECGYQTKIGAHKRDLVQVMGETRGPCGCQESCLVLGHWNWRFNVKKHECECVTGRVPSDWISRSNKFFSSLDI